MDSWHINPQIAPKNQMAGHPFGGFRTSPSNSYWRLKRSPSLLGDANKLDICCANSSQQPKTTCLLMLVRIVRHLYQLPQLMSLVGLKHFSFFHILGISSSKLTIVIFFRGIETTKVFQPRNMMKSVEHGQSVEIQSWFFPLKMI